MRSFTLSGLECSARLAPNATSTHFNFSLLPTSISPPSVASLFRNIYEAGHFHQISPALLSVIGKQVDLTYPNESILQGYCPGFGKHVNQRRRAD